MLNSQVRPLLLSGLSFVLLGLVLWQSLQLEYRVEAGSILDEANRSAQKLAFRTAEVLDQVSQTTLLVKHLRETGNPLTLHSLRQGGVLAQDVTQAVQVSDARGFVVEATRDDLALNIADEDYFKRLRKLPAGAVDLGLVEPLPALGGAAMPLSRRLSGSGGEFAGVVVALITPAVLVGGYGAGSEAQGTAVSVFGRDGLLRARLLDGRISFGDRVDVGAMSSRALDARRTGLPIKSRIDGVERFLAVVEVARYPLLAVVAVEAHAALANYRQTRQRMLAWAAGVALLLIAGTVALLVQSRRLGLSRLRQQEAAAKLAEQRNFLQNLLDYLPLPIYAKSARPESQGRYVFWNRAAERSFHRPAEQVLGRTVHELFPAEAAQRFDAQDALVLASGEPGHFAAQVFDAPDGRHFFDTTKVPLRGADGQLVLVIAEDITERMRHEQQLAEMARRDSLTGLPNRRHFEERLAEAQQRAVRSAQPMALLFVDLDGFKRVNDELGHEAGDRVLVEVARRLTACVRATDLVSRLGGDEFTVVLEDAESADAVQRLCGRIIASLSAPHALAGHSATAAPSIGLAMARPDEAPDSLLRRADDAMYAAKRAGKGRFALAP